MTLVAEAEFVLVLKLKGVATYPDGTRAEKDLELMIPVEDVNDNRPVFSFEVAQTTGAVHESSASGRLFYSNIRKSITI